MRSLQDGWPTFTLTHYNSTDNFDHFVGDDLTSWNHDNYPKRNPFAPFRSSLRERADKRLQYTFCSTPAQDGSTWHVQRVGVMTSHGGYDWWQASGRDIGKLSAALTAHGGDIFIVESQLQIVGTAPPFVPIGYPPMHLHHLHIMPMQASLRFQYAVYPYDGYYNNVVLERHGEWNPSVTSELEPEGYGRRISFTLDFDTECNDVRPAGSDSLTWQLQYAFRWRPGTVALWPLSTNNYINFGLDVVAMGSQKTYEGYFWVKPFRAWVSYYDSLFPPADYKVMNIALPGSGLGGRVLYVKSHVHMNLLVKAFIFASSPGEVADFLLTMPQPKGSASGTSLYTELPKAATSFDALEQLLRARVTPRCVLTPNFEKTADGWWDRPPDTICEEWIFEAGDPISFVSFLQYDCGSSNTTCPVEPWILHGGKSNSLPMHTEYFFTYAPHADGNETRNSCYADMRVYTTPSLHTYTDTPRLSCSKPSSYTEFAYCNIDGMCVYGPSLLNIGMLFGWPVTIFSLVILLLCSCGLLCWCTHRCMLCAKSYRRRQLV